MARRRLLCQTCSSILIFWGRRLGKKRYRCPQCKATRTYHRQRKRLDTISLFRHYVLWGLTYEMLSSISGYSVRFLEGKFHQVFREDPPSLPLPKTALEQTFLLLDGLWFGRWFVLMVYRQSGTLYLLHISVMGREVTSRISRDLAAVKVMGYHFTGVVSDGGTGIVSAVEKVFPHIPHQICLAHLHRDIIAAIGRYPKDERVKELKRLADHIWLIESKEALRWWKDQVATWIQSHHAYLKEKRYDLTYTWWYVHKGVRHAVATLKDLPETSFKFLDHPLMPKTTNEIEAQFGHLGKRWLAHRGMKRERWKDFLKWFVYFYNEEKLTKQKKS